jgi:hypothetical protein
MTLHDNPDPGKSADLPLSERHLADLRASGLSDDTILAAGLYTEKDPDRVREMLGSYLSVKTVRAMGPCLVFPYLDPAGAVMEYVTGCGTARPFVRLKPDNPRKSAKDKDRRIKYESPLGAKCRAYIPPSTRAALADPAVPLILTEGEKKALCADQVGLPCIGLGGVWAWQVARPGDANGRKIGPRELIPDLDTIVWHGREVNHPVVLQDGSLLSTQGYDPGSGLLVSVPAGLRLSVPAEPTAADVARAVAAIDDVLCDFPFERPEHRGAWYAGLLTPLAWFAFDGPAPLLLIDGNVRGVGKGLLADVIALILTGRRFPVMSYTSDREELRKKITSLAMEGERLVLLDNLAGAVGNDVLDMALTADHWRDRVLGVNREYDGPLHVNWYATGNNVHLHADTARRCSHCRLETASERPELRDDVKYPDLRRHVLEHRAVLLSAALTILRGWYAAGQPRHKGKNGKGLTPWGSFEGWSGVVREAVAFAGLPDPGETRLALQTSADRDALSMSAMLDALEQMDPCRRGVTTAEIIDTIREHERRKGGDPAPPGWHALLKSAVEDLCGKLDGRLLGYRFRHFKRRNFGGRMLDKAGPDADHANRWAVFPVRAG